MNKLHAISLAAVLALPSAFTIAAPAISGLSPLQSDTSYSWGLGLGLTRPGGLGLGIAPAQVEDKSATASDVNIGYSKVKFFLIPTCPPGYSCVKSNKSSVDASVPAVQSDQNATNAKNVI